MTAKAKLPPANSRPSNLLPPPPPTHPTTTEERLRHIEALSQRITSHVEFMGQIGTLHGTSAEAKDKAVLAFFERMVVLEGQLCKVKEELQLG